MKKIVLCLFLVLSMTDIVFAAIKTQEIDYAQGSTILKGYLAYDDASTARRPGILVVHEWWGHNEYARKRARMLAELGYVAFAVDMYGDGKHADHPDQAAAFMKAVNDSAVLSAARFNAAYEVIKNFSLTDLGAIGAIGYCFGGATVLKMAMAKAPLAGVVSFHGALALPQELPKAGDVKTKILVCNGGDDQFATAEQITAFKKALDDAKADYVFKVYPGAKHGFTNPEADNYAKKFGMALAYNAAADEQSWSDMKEFFKKLFRR